MLGISFTQEVIASMKAVKAFHPNTDVAIELGGEDAKISYFTNGTEQRMNGTCAGGTGSFIDQMATLLKTDAKGLNELAKSAKVIYPIAARCGVFAKTDVQPLLNEGVPKEDIAASVLQAVVIQTVSGLACGRPIRGNVAFLGGPLDFLPELRKRFIETLNLRDDQVIIPENSRLFIAKGAALASEGVEPISFNTLLARLNEPKKVKEETARLEPLFVSEEDYEKFKERHSRSKVARKDISCAYGDCFLGIDAGSTTTKLVLTDIDGNLLYTWYGSRESSYVYRERFEGSVQSLAFRSQDCKFGCDGTGKD